MLSIRINRLVSKIEDKMTKEPKNEHCSLTIEVCLKYPGFLDNRRTKAETRFETAGLV
jgi:hypothetical protein